MKEIYVDRFEEIFEIMCESFPADERRKKEEQRGLFALPQYRVFACEQKGKIIGFIAIWEFDDFVYVEHFALTESCRGLGLGSKMLKETAKLFEKPLCLEVEPPTTDIARREEFAFTSATECILTIMNMFSRRCQRGKILCRLKL